MQNYPLRRRVPNFVSHSASCSFVEADPKVARRLQDATRATFLDCATVLSRCGNDEERARLALTHIVDEDYLVVRYDMRRAGRVKA